MASGKAKKKTKPIEKNKSSKKPENTKFKSFSDWFWYEVFDWTKWIIIAYIIAQGLNFVFGSALSTNTPVMAVVSTSMLHDNTANQNYYAYMLDVGFKETQLASFPVPNGFDKGDVLVVKGKDEYEVGDVVVYHQQNYPYPIVHRILYKNGTQIITKGDHNPGPDPWFVTPSSIEGEVVLVIPKLGYIKVLPTDILAGISAISRGVNK